MAVRAPHLYRSLRLFCLAGFSLLRGDVAAGDELPFAFEEHAREPAAAIYAAAHSGKAGDQPLLRTIVLPLLADVAEACGGFDWSDEAFDRAYAELERSLLGARRTRPASSPMRSCSQYFHPLTI